MTRNQLKDFLESIGLTRNLDRLTWRLDITNRTEISDEMFLFARIDEKEILLRFLREQRRSLDAFIADLEKKVIEYKQP